MAPLCPSGAVICGPGVVYRSVRARPSPTRAPAQGAATGATAPRIRPEAYPAAIASTASRTPSGRPSCTAAVISDQAAQAPSTITPAASETFRLSFADVAPAADVIPVEPTPSPPDL